MKITVLMAVLTALLGCVSVKPPPQPLSSYQEGTTPELGEVHTATVGEVILSSYAYSAQRVAVTIEAAGPARNTAADDVGVMGVIFGSAADFEPADLPVGTRLPEHRVRDQAMFCLDRRCLHDSDSDGVLDRDVIVTAAKGTLEISNEVRIPYRIEHDVKQETESVKRDLVYQGRGAGTIKVQYREFQDGRFARPAFFQDLSYELAADGPTEIGFRSARIEVLEAGNTEIRYRVISGLQ